MSSSNFRNPLVAPQGTTWFGYKEWEGPPISVSGNSATNFILGHIKIDNSAGDTANGGHNTDAFNVGNSSGVTISNAHVQNQDDYLAVNSGSNITFTGGTCSGGHGPTIGSVGGRSNNGVSGIRIESSSISDSQDDVRIKIVKRATGSGKNVIYNDITLSGTTKYGVVIQQDYQNEKSKGNPTNGVPITDLHLSGVIGITGSVKGGKKSDACKNIPQGASC
ncbi:hypothetical protein DL767_007263 [Monosporascus sp. MG133]|nr:hypothetical protein DL767_007263 [Monosporascus sp. MG133]